jgi:hypothetical protein
MSARHIIALCQRNIWRFPDARSRGEPRHGTVHRWRRASPSSFWREVSTGTCLRRSSRPISRAARRPRCGLSRDSTTAAAGRKHGRCSCRGSSHGWSSQGRRHDERTLGPDEATPDELEAPSGAPEASERPSRTSSAQAPLCYNQKSGVVQGCCALRTHRAQVAGSKGPPQRIKFAPTTGSRQRILQ